MSGMTGHSKTHKHFGTGHHCTVTVQKVVLSARNGSHDKRSRPSEIITVILVCQAVDMVENGCDCRFPMATSEEFVSTADNRYVEDSIHAAPFEMHLNVAGPLPKWNLALTETVKAFFLGKRLRGFTVNRHELTIAFWAPGKRGFAGLHGGSTRLPTSPLHSIERVTTKMTVRGAYNGCWRTRWGRWSSRSERHGLTLTARGRARSTRRWSRRRTRRRRRTWCRRRTWRWWWCRHVC